jgi:hypothetical protein
MTTGTFSRAHDRMFLLNTSLPAINIFINYLTLCVFLRICYMICIFVPVK